MDGKCGSRNRITGHIVEAVKSSFLLTKLTCENIKWMIENPGEESEAMLYEIMDDILTLIQNQFPEFEEKIAHRRKRMAALAVHACEQRPELV